MNSIINELSVKKQQLMRDYDSGKITSTQYSEMTKDIEEKMLVERQRILQEIHDKPIVTDEATHYAPEPVIMPSKPDKKRRGPKVKSDSYISLIIKVLKNPEVKNHIQAVSMIDSMKPGRDRAKLEAHVKRIIYNVRKKTGSRWEMYEWNKDNYMLEDKNVE